MAKLTGTILLTGGTGFTSTMMAKLIKARVPSQPIIVASRSGSTSDIPGITGVKLDWEDSSTFSAPFDLATSELNRPIDRVYLVAPPNKPNQLELTKHFINLCKEKDVKRLLFMSSCMITKGSEWPWGQVHAYLDTIGLDYCVLRPSSFFGVYQSIEITI